MFSLAAILLWFLHPSLDNYGYQFMKNKILFLRTLAMGNGDPILMAVLEAPLLPPLCIDMGVDGLSQ